MSRWLCPLCLQTMYYISFFFFRCPNWWQHSSPQHSAHRGSPWWKSQHHQPRLSSFLKLGMQGNTGPEATLLPVPSHLVTSSSPCAPHTSTASILIHTLSHFMLKKRKNALFHFCFIFPAIVHCKGRIEWIEAQVRPVWSLMKLICLHFYIIFFFAAHVRAV